MRSTNRNGIKLFQFDSFDDRVVGHVFFGRNGGVSPAPWNSLNQGGGIGDERCNVIENRKRSFEAIDRPVESLFDVWQVHSADIVVTDKPRPLEAEHIKADAIITSNTDVTLFMRFADCVPILLYDPVKRIIATIHAGWQGTVKKIVEKTIQVMISKFSIDPKNIVAGIGPSIGPCHYQVGNEVELAILEAFPTAFNSLMEFGERGAYLNLWKANELQLRENGVKSIEVMQICTACHTDNWFSHRAEKGKTGRFAAALYLRKND